MKIPITIGETTAQCGEKVRGKLLAGEFSTGTEVYLPLVILTTIFMFHIIALLQCDVKSDFGLKIFLIRIF